MTLICHADAPGSIPLSLKSFFKFFGKCPNFKDKNKAVPMDEIWNYLAQLFRLTILFQNAIIKKLIVLSPIFD